MDSCTVLRFKALITDVRPLGLDYALTAMFLALLIPQCKTRLYTVVALFGGVCSIALKVAGAGQWNVIVATLLAATLGTFLSFYQERKSKIAMPVDAPIVE